MILIIVAGSLGGKYLDQKFVSGFPVYTLIGVLLSVFAALYLSLKDFLKK
ncbi:MAG: AtpZ/AtpI family protein [Bacteroidia bacterium]|nr:AtpZ/AtpI family protein [Bacteroidia bacterium]